MSNNLSMVGHICSVRSKSKKEDETEILVKRRDLPIDAQEGDVLVIGNDNVLKYYNRVKESCMPPKKHEIKRGFAK